MAARSGIGRCVLVVASMALALAAGAAEEGRAQEWPGPVLVSPGGAGKEGRVGSGCPGFSWAAVPGAAGYQVVIYELGEVGGGRKAAEEPVLRQEIPSGATSWTPELGECLAAGRYGWVVGALMAAVGEEAQPRWSQPAVFRVEAAASAARQAPRPAPTPESGRRVVLPPAAAAPGARQAGAPPRALTADAFTPGACTAGGARFADVLATDPFCRWIEQLDRDGIMEGCSPDSYCPKNPVLREQLAMFLGKTMRGTATWHPAQGSHVVAPPMGNAVNTVDDYPAPVDGVGPYTSVTIGADGLPIVSYLDATADALKVTHCDDLACVPPGETTTLVASVGDGRWTSITIGADGLPIISYYNNDELDLMVAHCNDVACAGQDETISSVDGLYSTNNVGLHTSIAIGADGLPIVGYYDQTAGALKVAHCDDPECTGSNETVTTVDDTENVGQTPSLAIGADGLPIIAYRAYFGAGSNSLKVAHCNDLACAGVNETITTVDDSGDVGYNASIAIGADGLPIISYHDGTGNLKVAHCNDVACAGAAEAISVVDDPQSTAGSITIGADGLPVIAYYDATAGALQVAHCNDLACAGQDETITTVDDPEVNLVGVYASITIGADGLPIISYYDGTAKALKVAHCANVFCTPFFRRR